MCVQVEFPADRKQTACSRFLCSMYPSQLHVQHRWPVLQHDMRDYEHACLSPPRWSTALISSLLLLCRALLQNTNSAREPETQHLALLCLRLLLFSSFMKCIIGDFAPFTQLAVLYLQIYAACASYSFMHVQEQLKCWGRCKDFLNLNDINKNHPSLLRQRHEKPQSSDFCEKFAVTDLQKDGGDVIFSYTESCTGRAGWELREGIVNEERSAKNEAREEEKCFIILSHPSDTSEVTRDQRSASSECPSPALCVGGASVFMANFTPRDELSWKYPTCSL